MLGFLCFILEVLTGEAELLQHILVPFVNVINLEIRPMQILRHRMRDATPVRCFRLLSVGIGWFRRGWLCAEGMARRVRFSCDCNKSAAREDSGSGLAGSANCSSSNSWKNGTAVTTLVLREMEQGMGL
ncbi:hypothetical protein BDR07DRAFT_1417410 [Suillus spraguei]|nr:hypothetical protein BDR07DRAFT_1417410 [Suillus spraguei]